MGAVVCMPMKNDIDVEVIDRLRQPGRAEEGKNLRRLADNSLCDWRVVKHDDRFLRAEAVERNFQSQRFIDCFCDEVLDRLFSERREHVFVESAAKALRARKS